ncbi:MAG: U32 family peptidase [Myxococcales bacterium]|nr:U32 family peptidase [Myxococcales bacterium]
MTARLGSRRAGRARSSPRKPTGSLGAGGGGRSTDEGSSSSMISSTEDEGASTRAASVRRAVSKSGGRRRDDSGSGAAAALRGAMRNAADGGASSGAAGEFPRVLPSVDTLTAAHDLDADQLFALLGATAPDRLTVTVHHHIPTFHTEHCVYAHLLSNGRDIRSCGQPCQDHEIGLRDAKGRIHPVVVDPACRNTVYNAQAQSAAGLVPRLLTAGVRRFRVEFVRETVEEAAAVLRGYRALLAGALTPAALVAQLRVHEQFGVTRGTTQASR